MQIIIARGRARVIASESARSRAVRAVLSNVALETRARLLR